MAAHSINLQRIIPGKPRRFTGRRQNVEEHLTALRKEFAGKPEVCFQVARMIVYLRRNLKPDESWKMLRDLLENNLDLCLKNFNTRWLISICDTYADYGTPQERANAMLISTVVNMVKLIETIRLVGKNPELDWQKVGRQKSRRLWNGVTTFNIVRGDMTRNLFSRINACFTETPVLEEIWFAVYKRLQTHDNILKQIHEGFSYRGIFPKLRNARGKANFASGKIPKRRKRSMLT